MHLYLILTGHDCRRSDLSKSYQKYLFNWGSDFEKDDRGACGACWNLPHIRSVICAYWTVVASYLFYRARGNDLEATPRHRCPSSHLLPVEPTEQWNRSGLYCSEISFSFRYPCQWHDARRQGHPILVTVAWFNALILGNLISSNFCTNVPLYSAKGSMISPPDKSLPFWEVILRKIILYVNNVSPSWYCVPLS